MKTYATTFVCLGLQGNVSIPAYNNDEIYDAFEHFFRECEEGFYSKNGHPGEDKIKDMIADILAEDFGVDLSEVEWSAPEDDVLDNMIVSIEKVS